MWFRNIIQKCRNIVCCEIAWDLKHLFPNLLLATKYEKDLGQPFSLSLLWNWSVCVFVKIAKCICPNCQMYLSGLRSTFFPEPAMKLIRIYICPNCTMYLSGLNTFPRACYEIDTLACILFGLSPDQIYQVSFLQYLAISCNNWQNIPSVSQ